MPQALKALNEMSANPAPTFYDAFLQMRANQLKNKMAEQQLALNPLTTNADIAYKNALTANLGPEMQLKQAQLAIQQQQQQMQQLQFLQNLQKMKMIADINGVPFDPNAIMQSSPFGTPHTSLAAPSAVNLGAPASAAALGAPLPLSDQQIMNVQQKTQNIPQTLDMQNANVVEKPSLAAPQIQQMDLEGKSDNILSDMRPSDDWLNYQNNLEKAKKNAAIASVFSGNLDAGQHQLSTAVKGTPAQNEIVKSTAQKRDDYNNQYQAALTMASLYKEYVDTLKNMDKSDFSFIKQKTGIAQRNPNFKNLQNISTRLTQMDKDFYNMVSRQFNIPELKMLREISSDPNQPYGAVVKSIKANMNLIQRVIINKRLSDLYYQKWGTLDGFRPIVENELNSKLLKKLPKPVLSDLKSISISSGDLDDNS
ncbi:MAG: hypothetical protein EKK56_00945 [Flavobacteriaceae bacterium]|nr:MAG: hypothetical protein EKK56_00945 [Flavobacteriaceae bacterium]